MNPGSAGKHNNLFFLRALTSVIGSISDGPYCPYEVSNRHTYNLYYLPLHHTGETSVFQDIIGISARHSLKWQRRTLLHRRALIRAQQCIRRIEPWHRAALRRDTAVRQRCRIQLSGLVMNLPGAEVLCIQCIIQSNLHVLYISDINVKTVTYCIHSLS